MNNSNLKSYVFFLMFIFLLSNNYAQIDKNKTYRIAHVKTITSIKDIKEEGFFSKISNWILGNESFELNKPVGIIKKNSQDFLVLDQGIGNIVEISQNENSMNLIDPDSLFPSLVSICSFSEEKFLFTDSKKNQVYVLNSENQIKLLNNKLELKKPTGIGFIKTTKEIWLSETGTHSLVILDSLGNFIKRIGTRGTEKGEFNFPTSIWVDNNEKIYVVDAMNFRIQIFDNHGNFIKMFGQQGDATGYFARPKGIATDSFGNIYVVDGLFHNVQIFDDKGRFLYNFGSQGTESGKFWLPTGIYIDNENNIYLADSYNSRIQIFKLIQN